MPVPSQGFASRPSGAEDEQEGVDPNAAVVAEPSLTVAEEAAGVSPPAVTFQVGSAAVAQRDVAPLRPAPPAGVEEGQGAPPNIASGNIRSDHNRPRSCAPWAFLHNLATCNITSDPNKVWRCGLGAGLLVFLLLGIVYLLMPHKFR